MWIIPKTLSAFAVDTVGSIEDLSLPELKLESSLMWRSKPSLLRTWSQRWKRVFWFRLLCGRILKPSLWKRFEDEYTASLPVILASPLALQDSEKERTTQDTSGHIFDKQLTFLNQDGASLRTSKDTSRLDSPQLSATWKKMVTELRQDCLRRQKSAHRTEEKECLSWATPNTMDYMDQRSPEALQRQFQTTRKGRTQPANLREQIMPENWPTVTARDFRSGHANNSEAFQKRKDNTRGVNLVETLQRCGLLDQGKSNTCGKSRGSLNPRWVEQLMGLPAGWTNLGSWATESFHNKQQKHT